MRSLTTLFRAMVMIASGVVVVQGWQLYGPSSEKVKSFADRALAVADAARSRLQSAEGPADSLTPDPRLATQPLAIEAPPSMVEPAPLLSAAASPESLVVEPAELEAAVGEAPAPEPPATSAASRDDDRLPRLFARLNELGASEPQITPWGIDRHLYRCQIRAQWNDSPNMTRHFEAIAAEPVEAVEQVVAKVESWRGVGRETTAMR